jgi:hypothetical protein
LKSQNSSLRTAVFVGIFIVLISWLIYSLFFDIYILFYMPVGIPLNIYPLSTYALEANFVGLIIRTVGVLLAMLAFAAYLRKMDISRVAKLIGGVVVAEILYTMLYAYPTAANGIFFIFQNYQMFIEATIPTIVQGIIMPVTLVGLALKLRSKTNFYGGALRWACIAGIAFLIVIWIRFTTQWVGTIVQPADWFSYFNGGGWSYVLNYPTNLLSFLLTVVGLPALTMYSAWAVAPAIRNPGTIPDLRKVGAVLTLLGGYFIVIHLLVIVFGQAGGYSMWVAFAIRGRFLTDSWLVSLPALGIPLMLLKSHKTMVSDKEVLPNPTP